MLCSVDGTTMFWNTDNKMRISMNVLILLYKEAKHAFIVANRQYKELNITQNVC